MKKKYYLKAYIEETDLITGVSLHIHKPVILNISENIDELKKFIQTCQDETVIDFDVEKEIENDNDKIIAKFMGYYQPDNLNDNDYLFSFQVYAHEENAEIDYPNRKIVKYTGEDIEDFEFIDEPEFDFDYLFSVTKAIQKIKPINHKTLMSLMDCQLKNDIRTYKTILCFIIKNLNQ